MSSLIFKVVFCYERCFNVVFCFVAGWFISWIWRWWWRGQLAISGTICYIHWLYFVFFFLVIFYKRSNWLSFVKFKRQCAAEFFWEFLIIDGLATFYHSKKTGPKTRPQGFSGFKNPSICLDSLHKVLLHFLVFSFYDLS